MNLLENEVEQPKEDKQKSQKLVLKLLFISIMLAVMIIIMIIMLKEKQPKPLVLMIDNKDIKIDQNTLISDKDGLNYISLKQLSEAIGYNYLRGGYKEYAENDSKCYLENEYEIIGFEANSKEIYKTTQNSKTDYEIYKLNNKIIQSNGMLYIALDDLAVGCTAICEYLSEENRIQISSYERIIENYTNAFIEAGYTISEENQNRKAIVYDMVVTKNQSEKVGVQDTKFNTKIGHKYTTMKFDELSQNFIVSNKDKYGIISKAGNIIIELKYEGIQIINYAPLLYEVKINNKVGVIDEKGNSIVNIDFDKLGCYENTSFREPVLIIKDLDEGKDCLVVCNKEKYGLVNMETGEMVLNCELEKIYGKKGQEGEVNYYVQQQGIEIELDKYIEYINTTTIVAD